MSHPPLLPLDRSTRRRAIRLAYANAGLWAMGNGAASTSLVVYLALELGAAGMAVSLILATPRLVGLLRMTAPLLVARWESRKKFCFWTYLLSNLLLLALPVLSAPGVLPWRGGSLAALVVLWSGYHLLEYGATVVLWAWLGDLVPARARGRFFGRRERWLTLGRIVGMAFSGLFAWYWWGAYAPSQRWIGYAIPAAVGALSMLASLVPLARMAEPPAGETLPKLHPLSALLAPLRDRRFARLLAFGCLFSLVNGITQAAQGIYPRVLGYPLLTLLVLESAMRFGQSGVSPWIGRFVDRFGNRPMMIAAQAVVAIGPLFYLLATPEAPWWLAGAWIAWIGYAGLNITLPNLALKLARRDDASAYIAAYFGVTGLVYGVSTLAGGALFDLLNRPEMAIYWLTYRLDAFDYLFVVGCAGRLLAVALLVTLVEPGAWRWRDIWLYWRGMWKLARRAPAVAS